MGGGSTQASAKSSAGEWTVLVVIAAAVVVGLLAVLGTYFVVTKRRWQDKRDRKARVKAKVREHRDDFTPVSSLPHRMDKTGSKAVRFANQPEECGDCTPLSVLRPTIKTVTKAAVRDHASLLQPDNEAARRKHELEDLKKRVERLKAQPPRNS